jgi:hypothetical protein
VDGTGSTPARREPLPEEQYQQQQQQQQPEHQMEEYDHDNDEPVDVNMDNDEPINMDMNEPMEVDLDAAHMDCFENDDEYDQTSNECDNPTAAYYNGMRALAAQQTTTPMTMTATATHTVVTDVGSTSTGTGSSAELVSHQNQNTHTHDTDSKDPVKRAIVFAPPSSSPKNCAGTHQTETVTNTNCWENDDGNKNNHQEPFLVSALFGQQTVGVGENVDQDNDSVDDHEEFGDMVRSWLVTVACCFVFCLVLLVAATAATTGAAHVEVDVEIGGHQQHSRGQSLAAPFFQKHHDDWTASSMSTSGGFSLVQSSPVLMPAS